MAETFYSLLGVKDDADAETIRSAYREQVKEHHPDVSDDPASPDQFKRLTTAKDVLVDDGERRRYDRLGHDDYVRDHLESSVWSADSKATTGRTTGTTASTSGGASSATRGGASSSTGTRGTSSNAGRTRSNQSSTGSAGGTDRTAWMGENATGRSGSRQRRKRTRRTAGTTATASEDWQHASEAYRRADTDVATGQQSLLRSVVSGLLSVGPWLAIHLVFIASAVATAYLAIVQADAHVSISWPTLVIGVLLLASVVFASVLHVVSQLYS